jgi:hypothetical protein
VLSPEELREYAKGEQREAADDEDQDRQWHARKHFPHLSASVAPRESDEYPTLMEDQ